MRHRLLWAVLIGPCVVAGCRKRDAGPAGQPSPASRSAVAADPSVRADGSSTVFPITEAVAEGFRTANPGLNATVGISGTGGGFRKFCAGETDVCNASRPIKSSEMELCRNKAVEYVELPIAYDGLAVLVNPKNDWAADITTDELKRLWEPEAERKVTSWQQLRSSWPDTGIHLYGAGVDSGTYDHFSEAIVHRPLRRDYIASEDDNVIVEGIANDEAALGFLGYAYHAENRDKLRLLPVDDGRDDNGKGPVAPSTETVMNRTYQPLSRPLFVYVSKKSLDRPAVERFLSFYLQRAPTLVKDVGYMPLPETAYALVRRRLMARKTGSMFVGLRPRTGVAIEVLLGDPESGSTQPAP